MQTTLLRPLFRVRLDEVETVIIKGCFIAAAALIAVKAAFEFL